MSFTVQWFDSGRSRRRRKWRVHSMNFIFPSDMFIKWKVLLIETGESYCWWWNVCHLPSLRSLFALPFWQTSEEKKINHFLSFFSRRSKSKAKKNKSIIDEATVIELKVSTSSFNYTLLVREKNAGKWDTWKFALLSSKHRQRKEIHL